MPTIKFTAGAGRLVPLPKSLATAPGGLQLYLASPGVKPRDVQPEQVVEKLALPITDAFVIRSLENGDLVHETPVLPKKEG